MTEKEFSIGLKRLETAFEKKVPAEKVELMYEWFGETSQNVFSKAITRLIRDHDSSRLPSIAAIKKAIQIDQAEYDRSIDNRFGERPNYVAQKTSMDAIALDKAKHEIQGYIDRAPSAGLKRSLEICLRGLVSSWNSDHGLPHEQNVEKEFLGTMGAAA